jgi:hypothetical protein
MSIVFTTGFGSVTSSLPSAFDRMGNALGLILWCPGITKVLSRTGVLPAGAATGTEPALNDDENLGTLMQRSVWKHCLPT